MIFGYGMHVFGLPGSNNDINVLALSHVFNELAEGCTLAIHYSINGHDYTMGYYLADGISKVGNACENNPISLRK